MKVRFFICYLCAYCTNAICFWRPPVPIFHRLSWAMRAMVKFLYKDECLVSSPRQAPSNSDGGNWHLLSTPETPLCISRRFFSIPDVRHNNDDHCRHWEIICLKWTFEINSFSERRHAVHLQSAKSTHSNVSLVLTPVISMQLVLELLERKKKTMTIANWF